MNLPRPDGRGFTSCKSSSDLPSIFLSLVLDILLHNVFVDPHRADKITFTPQCFCPPIYFFEKREFLLEISCGILLKDRRLSVSFKKGGFDALSVEAGAESATSRPPSNSYWLAKLPLFSSEIRTAKNP